MTDLVETMRALALWLGPAGSAALGFFVGAALGFAHFRSLAFNAGLFATGSPLKAGALQAARFALVVVMLFALAEVGALALLCGALGLLVARRFVLSRWGLA